MLIKIDAIGEETEIKTGDYFYIEPKNGKTLAELFTFGCLENIKWRTD
jgi:hypothetical protein